MDYRKYDKMEVTLHLINKGFISLSDYEKRRNSEILNDLLEKIINRMKQKDPVFKQLYTEIFYGGSYFDGLKVGKPDEYDIDMILGTQKSKKLMIEITRSDMPGFVHAKLLDASCQNTLCQRGSNDLDTGKVKQWIQSLVQKVLNDYPYTPNLGYNLRALCAKPIWIKFSTQGPACTLQIKGSISGQEIKMDVDLVPCFYCFPQQWPCAKPNPFQNMGFLIVPKKPTNHTSKEPGLYWRLSFQEQEREILNGKEKVKPALRLLKKMRDSLKHPVASYFLKTITLWELEKEDPLFWSSKSLSYTFMRLLRAYAHHLKIGKIPYYWDDRHNLLSHSTVTLQNFGNQLEGIIKTVDRTLDDEELIAKYILNTAEYDKLKRKNIPPQIIEEAVQEANKSCTII